MKDEYETPKIMKMVWKEVDVITESLTGVGNGTFERDVPKYDVPGGKW